MDTITPNLIDTISDLLKSGVREVFSTMLNMTTRPVTLMDFRAGGEMLVAGSVGFVGDVNGVVYIYVTASFARTLASRMLGLPEAGLEGEDLVNDVIGELTNMIVGSVKSRLCDSGSLCVLTIPSVVRGQNLSGWPVCSSEHHLLCLITATEPILIELLIKPPK
jgi:chemotaxis protein CheX